MRYCNHCGGEFRMEYVSKYPHKKYREVSDKYYDDSSDENSDLRTLIKKHNLKRVSLSYNEESHNWHISKCDVGALAHLPFRHSRRRNLIE